MAYIVVDLEFNQAFDFEHGAKTILNPNLRFEVIQIGMVKLDKNFELIGQSNILVRPQIYTRIHPYVAKMTGLDMRVLQKEKTFPEVFYEFVDMAGSEDRVNIFCFWGSTDIKILFRNIEFYNLDHSRLTKKYIDVQRLTNSYLKQKNGTSIGLKNAIEALNIEMSHPFHNAYYDAIYTAEILKLIKTNQMPVIKFERPKTIRRR